MDDDNWDNETASSEDLPDPNLRVCLPHSLEDCARFHLDLRDYPFGHLQSISITEVNGDASTPGWTNRTNVFFRSMWREQPFGADQLESVTSVTLNHLWLDDWEPLVRVLKHHGAYVGDLFLNHCFFTERGARTLGRYLYEFSNKYDPDFRSHMTAAEKKSSLAGLSCLETVAINNAEGSNSWMLGNELFSQYQTCFGFFHWTPTPKPEDPRIQNLAEIKKAECSKLRGDSGGFQDMSLEMQNLHRQFRELRQTGELDLKEKKDFPLNLCQAIGKFLRQSSNLVELYVHHVHAADELPHDFLLDAVNCTKLTLDDTKFDPRTVAFLVHGKDGNGAGNLKNLKLKNFDEIRVAKLLELVDLSLLDSLELTGDFREKKHVSRVFDSFCHRFAKNEGPKRLSVNLQDDLNNFIPQLTPSLIGNNKIEFLEIHAISCSTTNDGGLQQLFDAIGKMPNLEFWSVGWDEKEDNVDEDTIDKWNDWILDIFYSNWNIQDFAVEVFDLKVKIVRVMMENKKLKKWPPLLRQKENVSSGIWSLALSRFQKDDEVSLLYRVLREVPGLIQQAAESSSEKAALQLPRFRVPHHPDCLGCRQQRKQCASGAISCPAKKPRL